MRRILADGVAGGRARRVFDVGCGNGATARALVAEHWEVAGVDPSRQGIAQARASGLDLRVGSAYDDLATAFGRWPFVLCLEVVEHVYFPHRLARTLFELCEPGALAIVSTPYHGYWKNLALSLVPGAWDRHHHPLSDHGHIKFLARALAACPAAPGGVQRRALQASGSDPGACEIDDRRCAELIRQIAARGGREPTVRGRARCVSQILASIRKRNQKRCKV